MPGLGYDEQGSLATYFVLTFLSLALFPSTFYSFKGLFARKPLLAFIRLLFFPSSWLLSSSDPTLRFAPFIQHPSSLGASHTKHVPDLSLIRYRLGTHPGKKQVIDSTGISQDKKAHARELYFGKPKRKGKRFTLKSVLVEPHVPEFNQSYHHSLQGGTIRSPVDAISSHPTPSLPGSPPTSLSFSLAYTDESYRVLSHAHFHRNLVVRSALLLLGWFGFAFLTYKVVNTEAVQNVIYDPFSILGISEVSPSLPLTSSLQFGLSV